VAGYGGAIHCLGVLGILLQIVFEVLIRHKSSASKAYLDIYSVTTCMFFDPFGSMLDSYLYTE
jgi:hypothetical protein